ncbi:tetraacyldisaccharide 4'-kinase [Neiella marina]|uniref:Tetraacyldisaccharide 4'-kinase n=1 Tax=Neiella holothuriorum TaxID=2870530 RepID=A0ABS7EDC2_9GAMM|nr:tetraacyldisaccharide 4'-kinase [Neiella holothuriorum]MBW8190338.1 tetraacyldisaccharide 4'-kinase [Neiella holothuriorum]
MKIEQAWQSNWSWTVLLLPFSLLYYLIVQLRRLCFKNGLLKIVDSAVPVVVVGNISAGGNGKTPVVLWLAQLLLDNGYKPAVVSRGYGGQGAKYPLVVSDSVSATHCGDEPKLIARRLAIPVVVDPNRANAVAHAVSLGADVVISDDGMQHYRMARAIELAVVDGQRRHGNGWLLPSGPLREPQSRLDSVFAVICNGSGPRHDEFSMRLEPHQHWCPVAPSKQPLCSADLANKKLLAVAGIGNPQRFFDTVAGLDIQADTLPLNDHAAITQTMIDQWQSHYDLVLMTEKDVVKCSELNADKCYYLPVDARIDSRLAQQILTKLNTLNGVDDGV